MERDRMGKKGTSKKPSSKEYKAVIGKMNKSNGETQEKPYAEEGRRRERKKKRKMGNKMKFILFFNLLMIRYNETVYTKRAQCTSKLY